MRKLGINETMHIVVYDASGLFSAPRVWWTLRTFGAKDVKILAGGLPKWKEEGRQLESGEVKRPPQTFAVAFDASRVSSAADVLAASQSGSAQIVDARGAPRFLGQVAEPRPGLRSGHIPKSKNVPYRDVIENGADACARGDRRHFYARGSRSRQADCDELRLGRDRGHFAARARDRR